MNFVPNSATVWAIMTLVRDWKLHGMNLLREFPMYNSDTPEMDCEVLT